MSVWNKPFKYQFFWFLLYLLWKLRGSYLSVPVMFASCEIHPGHEELSHSIPLVLMTGNWKNEMGILCLLYLKMFFYFFSFSEREFYRQFCRCRASVSRQKINCPLGNRNRPSLFSRFPSSIFNHGSNICGFGERREREKKTPLFWSWQIPLKRDGLPLHIHWSFNRDSIPPENRNE